MTEKNKKNESEESSEIKVEVKKSKNEEPEPVEIDPEIVEDAKESESSEQENSKEQEVEDKDKKIDELNDRILRLSAEFDNYKKRTARQYEDMIKLANLNILSQLLEVIDNFERAISAVEKTDDKDALKKGAEMIYQQMLDILKKEQVEPIEAVGQPFDPNLHEAMMQAPSDEYEEGIIISEMVRGYKLKEKVIRYSKVVVSQGPATDDNSDEN